MPTLVEDSVRIDPDVVRTLDRRVPVAHRAGGLHRRGVGRRGRGTDGDPKLRAVLRRGGRDGGLGRRGGYSGRGRRPDGAELRRCRDQSNRSTVSVIACFAAAVCASVGFSVSGGIGFPRGVCASTLMCTFPCLCGSWPGATEIW